MTYSVILGAHDVYDKNSTTDIAYFAQEIIIHPDFNFTTKGYDVALIKVNTTIQYTDAISPICLSDTPPVPGQTLEIAGWGLTLGPMGITNILQKTNVTVECDEICALRDPLFNTTSMFCASGANTGFCERDTGGAAFTPYSGLDSNFIQYGIISFGDACNDPFNPGYYTDVSTVKGWIQQTVYSCLC